MRHLAPRRLVLASQRLSRATQGSVEEDGGDGREEPRHGAHPSATTSAAELSVSVKSGRCDMV